MTRNRLGISKLAATAALLVAALGCEADGSKSPGQQLASPVTPLASQHVSISSSRQTLTVGRDDVFAQLTVQALAPDFAPLPNGTDVVLTTNLGAFDSPSGGQTVTLDLVGGQATARFYPGSTEGSARVVATVNGNAASVTINIRPDPTGGLPPEPAPTGSQLTLVCSPSSLGEDDPGDPLTTTCQGTVTDQKGDPFKNGGVRLESSDGLGDFDSSGGPIGLTQKTDSAGFYSDTLVISKADLLAFSASSFTVTAFLGSDNGELTKAFEVTIVEGQAPAEPSKITLQASTSFVNDNGLGASIDLDATVQDQFGALVAGGSVVFKSSLGSPSPVLDVSDGSGLAESTLALSGPQIAAHPTNSFSLTAELTTSSGTVISSPPISITIVRSGEAPEADNVTLNASTSFVDDDGGANKVIDLEATVQDQFGALFTGGQVSFS
ncbi:MAG: hypothetical protein NDJ75_04470, partial [Thermoanaerobaculia bacterium]|nr:hypothetical protein [Thermoanaerobaculia bacterium]